ncbi:MAG: ATP-binding cassette domain-containing protein [Faecalibacillus faecis]
MRLFEAKNLIKKYDKTVLNHLDFSINEGEVVGVIGVSGCGKSTLARLVSGIENLLQVLYYIKEKQLI